MGLIGQRRSLVGEIEDLQDRRLGAAGALSGASREQASVLRQTIAEIDQQLAGARTALRSIEGAIAARQGTPVRADVTLPAGGEVGSAVAVAAYPAPVRAFPDNSQLSMYLGAGALTLVALSIAVGMVYARRLRRDTAAAIERLQADLQGVLHKLTHGVDAVAVEVERIGEGQRFVTKALAEKKEPI